MTADNWDIATVSIQEEWNTCTQIIEEVLEHPEWEV